ncbi:nucleotidyltransferase family protein [Candidatus Saganbacteria bacterium]|nr:nucleotidyltransferase family protein [Candidatus Saganbacteria bacterium]
MPILKRHDVVKAAIFRSFARGEEKKNSDLDLLMKFSGVKSLLDLSRLKIELENLLNKKVDVVTYASIDPKIRDRILKEQVPII